MTRLTFPRVGRLIFGEIYNTAAGQQDITFDFAEAGSTATTNGPTYYGAEVDYVTTPEPGSISMLAIGAGGDAVEAAAKIARLIGEIPIIPRI